MRHRLSVIGRNMRPVWACMLVGVLVACNQHAIPAVVLPAPTAVAPTATAESALPSDQTQLQRYRHSSGLFALDIPPSWHASDHSRAGELITQFTDENENAVIVSNVLTMTSQLSDAMLAATLEKELAATYGMQPGFQQSASRQTADGQQILWQYRAQSPDGAERVMQGQSVICQRGQYVGLLTVVAPSEQQFQPIIDAMLGSYTLGSQTPAMPATDATTLAPITLSPLQPYTADARFKITVPAAWAKNDQSSADRTLVTWSDQSGNAWLVVNIVADDSQRSPRELAALLAKLTAEALGGQPDAYTPLETQPDHRAAATWAYRSQADNQIDIAMQGTGFAVQQGQFVAIVVASLPTSQGEAGNAALQAMLDSFAVAP